MDKKLIWQIMKFTVVGGISFLVDFAVYGISCNVIGIHYIISGILGFVISVIVNYMLSMSFVFKSKENTSKQKEFVLFVVLSVIGLIINSLILYICIDGIYMYSARIQAIVAEEPMNLVAKIIATAIVMIYNFISRKLLLEEKTL